MIKVDGKPVVILYYSFKNIYKGSKWLRSWEVQDDYKKLVLKLQVVNYRVWTDHQ